MVLQASGIEYIGFAMFFIGIEGQGVEKHIVFISFARILIARGLKVLQKEHENSRKLNGHSRDLKGSFKHSKGISSIFNVFKGPSR